MKYQVGEIIKVGFVGGLKVERIAPWGAYILSKINSLNQPVFYEFMPHQGMRKIIGSDNIAKALGR